MENPKNRRNLLKRIGAIVGAIACAVAVLFVPFSAKIEPKNMLSASANDGLNYTEFKGSNVIVPVSVSLNHGLTYSGMHYVSMWLVFYADGFRFYMGDASQSVSSPLISYNDVGYHISSLEVGNLDFSFDYEVSSSAFDFSSITFVELSGYVHEGIHINAVRYHDANGNRVLVNAVDHTGEGALFDSRQYLFGSSLSGTEDYRVGYASGYAKGNSDGYSRGTSDGYSSGYNSGITVGYNNGYNEGVEHGSDYTFTSLVSSFIDVPVQTFMGLFNFELLGVNLAGFFTGLLTLAFILTVVRILR